MFFDMSSKVKAPTRSYDQPSYSIISISGSGQFHSSALLTLSCEMMRNGAFRRLPARPILSSLSGVQWETGPTPPGRPSQLPDAFQCQVMPDRHGSSFVCTHTAPPAAGAGCCTARQTKGTPPHVTVTVPPGIRGWIFQVTLPDCHFSGVLLE